MWAFDWIRDDFSQAGSWFEYAGSGADSIPLIGGILSSPFYNVASVFYSAASAAGSASTWADSVYSDAYRVFQDIQYQALAAWPVLQWSGYQFFDVIRGYAESTWQVLSWTGSQFFDQVRYEILAAWPLLQWDSYQFLSWVRGDITAAWWILSADSWALFGYIRSQISGTWSILADTKETIWTWITSGLLQQWVGAWWTGQQAAVLQWVQGSMHYFIEQGFMVLGNSWASFTGSFTWLLDKFIGLMFDQVEHFAPALWALLEAVLRNIEVRR